MMPRMDARLPSFFNPPASLPPFFAPPQARPVTPAQLRRAVSAAEFEMVFPRILEMMAAGSTANRAIKELGNVIDIDSGGFMRWVKKDAGRYALYQEAQEIRSEVWADKMLDIAEGKTSDENLMPMELDRAKFAVDTYKFLIKAQNKKVYGDTKQIEVNQTISILGALEAAKSRVSALPTIDIGDDDYEVMEPSAYRQIEAPTRDEYEDDDDDG